MTEREIFIEALTQPPAERASFLNQACGPDAALRRRLERLLVLHDNGCPFLDQPAAELATASTPCGTPDCTLAQLAPFLGTSRHPGALGRLGHYDVLEVLGQGGCGIVLRALDDKLQRVVAVKVLAPHLAATSPPRERFLREARAAAQVRHENVVGVYAVEEEPIPYLVMEFIDGPTVQAKLDAEGPLPPAEAARLGRQVALGLAAAHEKGLIHRDVKPANILLEARPEPRARLTDFGLARAADDASLTQSGVLAGTPMYMSPEQARGGEVLDHRADLFSLGSVLYTMVTGRPPFRAATPLAVLKRVAEDSPRPLREVIGHVPPGLITVINRLMEKRPAHRFASAGEAAEALERCLPHPAPARNRWRTAWPWAAAGLASLLVVAAGLVIASGDRRGAGRRSEATVRPEATTPTAATTHPKQELGLVVQAEQKPPALPPDIDRDREAAEWVVSFHFGVRINGEDRTRNSPRDLPDDRFTLTWVTLHGHSDADTGLAKLSGLTGLTELFLSTSSVTDAGLSHLEDCTGLTLLHLHNTAVSDVGLASLSRLARLQVLGANDTKVTDIGLAHLTSHPELSSLAVCDTAISDAGLAELRALKQLNKLYIAGTAVTDAGLAHLEPHTELTTLDLSRLAVTDAGLAHLKGLTKLEWLKLRGSPVTDKGLACLVGCKALAMVDVKQTKVTAKGVADLHAAHPGCQILHESGEIAPDP